ncbi:hypothetical protein RFI_08177 [Reticulomyxa filosa]|uniref:Uncharacterized protein n=1 Tax=Reticulomyxa filosa TaxID=46433 RepID=X6NSI5_RETFI|nr:hypothetical protein RFI_08177 [Reticulomyxa filosa]|eukprot:ETO28951.1 hypothetical protein RFI_08177 [Reticulomyxa filosa]
MKKKFLMDSILTSKSNLLILKTLTICKYFVYEDAHMFNDNRKYRPLAVQLKKERFLKVEMASIQQFDNDLESVTNEVKTLLKKRCKKIHKRESQNVDTEKAESKREIEIKKGCSSCESIVRHVANEMQRINKKYKNKIEEKKGPPRRNVSTSNKKKDKSVKKNRESCRNETTKQKRQQPKRTRLLYYCCPLLTMLLLVCSTLFFWNMEELRMLMETFNDWKKLHGRQLENELKMQLEIQTINFKLNLATEKLIAENKHIERMALIQFADRSIKKFIDSNTRKVQKWSVRPCIWEHRLSKNSKLCLMNKLLPTFDMRS